MKVCLATLPQSHLPEPLPLPEGGRVPPVHPDGATAAALARPDQAVLLLLLLGVGAVKVAGGGGRGGGARQSGRGRQRRRRGWAWHSSGRRVWLVVLVLVVVMVVDLGRVLKMPRLANRHRFRKQPKVLYYTSVYIY